MRSVVVYLAFISAEALQVCKTMDEPYNHTNQLEANKVMHHDGLNAFANFSKKKKHVLICIITIRPLG